VVGTALIATWPSGLTLLASIGLEGRSWLVTLAWAAGWLALMVAYSPVADAVASRYFAKPPTLGAFRPLQQSLTKLLLGIVIAWLLGAFLEELAFRGLVLSSTRALLAQWIPNTAAAVLAICIAAAGAGIVHLYQGARGCDHYPGLALVRRSLCSERLQSMGNHSLPRPI